MTSDAIVHALQLQPHPEGGHYREFYRCALLVETPAGNRAAATAIYFLLKSGEVSHFHRLAHDEIWCWHHGSTVTIYTINADGIRTDHTLGPPEHGGNYSFVVQANTWFAAKTTNSETLVTAVVAPGFDFADFELGNRATLCSLYPEHAELITQLALA